MDKILQIANIAKSAGFNNPQKGRIYSTEGVSPTIDTMQGGNSQPKILEII